MAVSVEAAFVLLDKASRPLKDIQRQAILTDKALNSMGSGTAGTSKLKSFTGDLEAARGGMKDLGGETGKATSDIKKLGKEVEKTGGFFKRHLKSLKDWTAGLIGAHPALKVLTTGVGVLATGVGALGGALKGAATAFPLLVTGATLAAPAVVALVGAVGSLVSSLTFAVGGGAILGGGLLGAFGVGLGSLVAVGKPALASLKTYDAAVTRLNTAIATGNQTTIKSAQATVDHLAKQNPQVAALSGNLKEFKKQWDKATKPAQKDFFGLANTGISTLHKLMPTLATQVNKNVGAISRDFKSILAPFLDSKAFKGIIGNLGGVFRTNLPGFMRGFVDIIKGLGNILKDILPTLDKAGGGFQKMGKEFEKWTGSKRGKNAVKEMVDSFKEWARLIKGLARILGDVLGAGAKTGTDRVKGWADSVNKAADSLSKKGGTTGIKNYFDQSMKQTDRLWPILKNVATSLAEIYKVFKPLGSATEWLLRNLPSNAVAALAVGWLGFKTIKGAASGASGVAGLLNKFASRGGRGSGVAGALATALSEQGATPLKPLYVEVVNEGFGLGPGGIGTKGAAVETEAAALAKKPGLFERLVTKIPGGSKLFSWLRKGDPAASALTRIPLYDRAATLASKGGSAASKIPGLSVLSKIGKVPILAGIFAALGFVLPGAEKQTLPGRAANAAEALDPTSLIPGYGGFVHSLLHPLLTGQAFGSKGWDTQVADAKLKNFQDRIKEVQGHLADLTPKTLQGLMDWANKLARDPNLKQYKQGLWDVRDALKDPTTGLYGALQKVQPEFDYMRKSAGDDLGAIQLRTQFAVQDITDQLGTKSKAATDALATNYAIAAQAVKTSMKDGVIKNTKDGIAEVNRLMTKAFQELGISPGVAKKLASQHWSLKAVAGAQAGAKYIPPTIPGHAQGGRLPGPAMGDHLPLYGRGGSLLGIADGGELVVNRHTENRVNTKLAAYGTTLGKEVAGETRPHYAHGGRVPGYATGGVVGEVNQFFSQRGWDKAAIAGILGNAMQESSLNPNTPGGGMWQQISNFGSGTGGSLNAQMNRMYPQIVSLRGAMNSATPAGAAIIFEQGFEKAGIPAMANRIRYAQMAYTGRLGGSITGGLGVPMLGAPRIGGFGFQQAFAQGAVNNYTAAANFILQAAAGMSGGGLGAGGFGGSMVPGGAGTVRDPSGKPVAAWIEPILNYARKHGWGGSVSSGWRSYAAQAAIYNSGVRPAALPGTSNHEQTRYPGGAVDVTDAAQLSAVLMRSPYGQTLVWAGAKDPVHFSHPHGGSYSHGGRIPWFAGGADFIANRPQLIGVGDGPGGERVTVTPQSQNTAGGRPVTINIGTIEVNRKGDVQRIVDEEMALLANSIGRTL